MPSYVKKTVACNCCGRNFQTRLLKGFFSEQPLGLDCNPHHPAAYDRVTSCPHCGYSSSNMNADVSDEIRQVVNSSKYKDVRNNLFFDDTTKKLLLAGYISAKKADYLEAAYSYLMAMWHFCELNSDMAVNAREKAITYFSRYLNKNRDDEMAIVLIDLLRQASKFTEAEETAISLEKFISNNEALMPILLYERKLIKQKDSETHSVKEVAS